MLKTCELFCFASDYFECLTPQYAPQHTVRNFLFMVQQHPVGQGLLIIDASRSHTHTHHAR